MADANLTTEELRSIAQNSIRTTLFERVYQAYEDYRQEHNIAQALYAQVTVPSIVTDEQTDAAVDEFIGDYPDIKSQDEVIDAVKEYIDDNYDEDFLTMQIERLYDLDVVLETAYDELLLILGNTAPYADVSEEYWSDKVKRANLDTWDMVSYATEDGVHRFVEEHTPDWESEANEY